MQEQVNEKTVALYIKTGKLTAEMLQRAMKKLLSQMKKQADRPPHGKQTLKQLMKQNAGVSNIEITGPIKCEANHDNATIHPYTTSIIVGLLNARNDSALTNVL